jgi:NhaP-type Na+/H+ or K+/H+ antiporter
VGAISAGVALEVVLQPSTDSLASGALSLVSILVFGALLGLAGGLAIALLLRPRWLIPEGLENVFTLSVVLALFHLSNALQPESGIGSVTVAGIVVGNMRTRGLRDLMEFKEQITVMLIGMLFVLLAADVRLAELRTLGSAGLATVLVLMVVVRPLNVLAATVGSKMTVRERAFLSWMAPRGIVAAAVASFFAVELDRAGIAGGSELRAMVFLVIAVTVLVQGLTGGPLAGLLGVRRKTGRGYAILGANDLSRAVGRALHDGGEEVLFIDSNADATHAAEQDGFRVVFGNALEERTLLRARMDSFAGCIGLTPNEEVNLLFVTRVHEEFKVPRRYVGLHLDAGGGGRIIKKERSTR